MKLINKICVITDIRVEKRGSKQAFEAPKTFTFEGVALGKFRRRDFFNFNVPQKKAIIEAVKFTTCYSKVSNTKPGTGFKTLVLMGRDSLALYGPELSQKDFKKWIGKKIELEDGRTAIVTHSAYDMQYWAINPTHKESEKGRNRFTHYVRTAYQIMTDTLPLSTRTAVKFCLNVDNIKEMVANVQATKYGYYDVETFPLERNVPKEKRLEYNTTFFRALCRTIQVSHQAGAAYTVPVYDFESPLNVGKDDVLEFGLQVELTEGKGKAQTISKIFTPVPDPRNIPEDYEIYLKRNGELVTEYDGDDLNFRREFAYALYDNWNYCKDHGVNNYFKDLCFPLMDEGIFKDRTVRKRSHNATFDYNVCRYPDNGLGFTINGILGDTMEQIHVLDKTKPLGLKPLSELLYPEFIGYGDDVDYENDHLYEIGEYGGTDTDLGTRLDTFQTYQLLADPRLLIFYLNVKVSNISFFADLEYEGCYIDKKKLEAVKTVTGRKANIFKDRLDNTDKVKEYVFQRLKKEREEASTIVDYKLVEWYGKTLKTIEARLKKMEEEGNAYKENGEPYSKYKEDLGKKEWVLAGITSGYWEPKSPYKYKRPLDLQEEKKNIEMGVAEKAYLFDNNPSDSQYEKGKFFIIQGKTQYITAQKKPLFREMNYNSTDHLGDFVYLSPYGLKNVMPVTTAKETDPETGRKKNVRKQRPTTTRKEITALPDPTGFLNALMIYKALNYVLQSCEEIETKLDPKGYIHTQYSYTNTDRSKSARPNLQNVMQRSPFEEVRECVDLYKEMFTVPDGNTYDWVYYKRDLSQAELRWFCYVYRILSMAVSYDHDEDLHEKTTAAIMGITVEELRKLPKAEYKIHRTNVGKGNNFGNIYGISAKGFQEYVRILFGYVITLEEAKRQQDQFFALYPEIREAHIRQIRLIHELGYSETPFGNRRQLPDLQSSIPYFQAEAERHGVNQPVQGAAGVAMMFSAVVFRVRRIVIGLEGRTINLIHDDVPGYMRKDQSYRYQVELREACNRPPFQEYFNFDMDIAKMKSDAEVGLNWNTVTELPDIIKKIKTKKDYEHYDPDYAPKTAEEVLLKVYPDQNPIFMDPEILTMLAA